MIGTNRDLERIESYLEREIHTLRRLARSRPDQAWISSELVSLGQRRIAVSATLANRHSEAAKKIVDLARWYNGNGALNGIGNWVAPSSVADPSLIA